MKRLPEVHLSASLSVLCCDLCFFQKAPQRCLSLVAAAVEWTETKKMCCFCTNSDVIGTASQTVWTGGGLHAIDALQANSDRSLICSAVITLSYDNISLSESDKK